MCVCVCVCVCVCMYVFHLSPIVSFFRFVLTFYNSVSTLPFSLFTALETFYTLEEHFQNNGIHITLDGT